MSKLNSCMSGHFSLLRLSLSLSIICIGTTANAQNDAQGLVPASRELTLSQLKEQCARRSSYRRQQQTSVDTKVPRADMAGFKKNVLPVLKKYCVQCHGAKKREGNIRIDTLDPNLLTGKDVSWWLEIAAVLTNGEMPPADAKALPGQDRSNVIEWLSDQIQTASIVRRAEHGHSSFRRMTRYEYNYALQDLLGLPYDFAEDLPPESRSEEGFQNTSETLHMSVSQFQTYRELSRKALERATVRGSRPAPIFWGISMKAASAEAFKKQEAELNKIRQQFKGQPDKLKKELARRVAKYRARQGRAHYKNLSNGHAAAAGWSYYNAKHAWKPTSTRPATPAFSQHVAVLPPGQRLIVELGNRVPDRGLLRVRIRAQRATTEANGVPSLQLEFGWQASNDSQATVRVSQQDLPVEALPGKPQFYEWEIPLGEIYPRNWVRKTSKMGQTPSPSEYIKLVNSSRHPGDIHVDYVEITAPVYKQWPPQSHRQVFIDSQNQTDEAVYAREVLTNFMSRAWRRAISSAEVDQKMALFKRIRPDCTDFQEAVIEVAATVLSSPKFLYLVRLEQPKSPNKQPQAERLSNDELASRLAMFLWSSLPDEELRSLAAKGKLNDKAVLQQQVRRMLADPRAQRFREA